MSNDTPPIPPSGAESGRDDYHGPSLYIDPYLARRVAQMEIRDVTPSAGVADHSPVATDQPINEPRFADRVASMVLKDTQRELDTVKEVTSALVKLVDKIFEDDFNPNELIGVMRGLKEKLGIEDPAPDQPEEQLSSYRRRRKIGEEPEPSEHYHAMGQPRTDRRQYGKPATADDPTSAPDVPEVPKGDLITDPNILDAPEVTKEILDWLEKKLSDDNTDTFTGIMMLGTPIYPDDISGTRDANTAFLLVDFLNESASWSATAASEAAAPYTDSIPIDMVSGCLIYHVRPKYKYPV